MAKRQTKTIKNAKPAELGPIMNGLTEAVMGFTAPFGQGTQLQQVDTLFANNRFYLVSNMRQPLSESYAEHGLVKTIVDIPVDDAFRGGIEIKSKQLSTEQIEDILTEMESENDLDTLAQTMKWDRLFGGAGTVILTGQPADTEFDIELLKEGDPFGLRAVDLWELFWDKQNTEGFSAELQMQNFTHYSYYGKKLHKSRVMEKRGVVPPSFIKPRLRGWGLSVVEVLINSINQYLKTNNLVFEVLDEFKLDIFKLKGLNTTLASPTGTRKIQERTQIANMQKNFLNALTLDADDSYEQKQLTFSGIAEVMQQIRLQVASDLRMPLTKIFGISASGFSSGQDDIENYNAMVESTIRSKCKPDIIRVIKIRCQRRFGFVPTDITVSFKPLRILSAVDEETVKDRKFARMEQAVSKGFMSIKEFKEGCNKDNLLSVQLDTSVEQLIPTSGNAVPGSEDANENLGLGDEDAGVTDFETAEKSQGGI